MKVAPSLLAADFANLGREVEMLNKSNADLIHCDVMDGVFVPNISFGFPVLKRLGQLAEKPLDVHLMIVKPERYVGAVRDTGAYLMNIHQEACLHLHRAITEIHAAGMKAGVTLCPATPVETLTDIIGDLDMVLLMSVDPGFGGQPFIPRTLDKIRRLRSLIEASGAQVLIEIDGGINLNTGKQCAEAGADILVAGSNVFRSDEPQEAIDRLRAL